MSYGYYARKRKERRAKVWGAVAFLITGVAVGVGIGVGVGVKQGVEQENSRANTVISDYMAGKYGADMLEQCRRDGLNDCKIEFSKTDGIITGIEVVGRNY